MLWFLCHGHVILLDGGIGNNEWKNTLRGGVIGLISKGRQIHWV